MKKLNLLNQKFGKLLVIGETDYLTRVKWLCKCDCGNTKIAATKELRNGNTKSCGCIHKESSSKNALKAMSKRRQHKPKITSARRAWRENYNDGLSFDEFYSLSQQNCFYCDSAPSNKTNYFYENVGSTFSVENGLFVYNGLDRVDSSKIHTIDNVVPCCYICNRAKRERSLSEFYGHIDDLITTRSLNRNLVLYRSLSKTIDISLFDDKTKYSLTSSIRSKFNTGYNDGDLSLYEFYQLSQLNCFYCNIKPSNKIIKTNKRSSEYAKTTGVFVYSGLDRLDCKFPHNYDNVTPSCKYCNYAKRELSLDKFNEWIFKLNEKKKPEQI